MTRVTYHVMTVMTKKIADDNDANAFMLLYFLTVKQHKKRTIWVRCWLLDRQVICWSTCGRTFHQPIVFGNETTRQKLANFINRLT